MRNDGRLPVTIEGVDPSGATTDPLVVTSLELGDGADPTVTMGPLINTEALEKVEAHIADAVDKGARVLAGGKRHALGGSFFEPTVLADVSRDALVSCDETFGPLATSRHLHGSASPAPDLL